MVTAASQTPIIYTDSEFFPDGTALELVHAKDSKELMLLEYANGSAQLAPTIKSNGRTYAPAAIDETLARRLVLPGRISAHGSTRDLTRLIKCVVQSTGVIHNGNVTIASYFAIAS